MPSHLLASGFRFDLASAGAYAFQDELRSDDLIIQRMYNAGGLIDETIIPWRTAREGQWSRLRIVLRGPVFLPSKALTIDRGRAFGAPHVRGVDGRALTRSSDWLDIMWRNQGSLGTRLPAAADLRLSASALEQADLFAQVLAKRDVPLALRAAKPLFHELRSLGLPLTPDSLSETDDLAHSSDRHFAQSVEKILGQFSLQSMAVDLSRELNVCERQALRRASRYFSHYYLGVSSWRELLVALRIEIGTFLVSAPKARTEDVSRYLGFSTPTSFCHALQNAGLPSPQAIQHELRCA